MQRVKLSSTNAKIKLLFCLTLPLVLYGIPLEWITHGGNTICLFHNIFGRDCYGCGMTRALFSLMHSDPVAAWGYNKLVIIVAPVMPCLYIKKLVETIGEC